MNHHPLSEALIHLGTALEPETPMELEQVLDHVRQAYTILQTEILREYAMHKHDESAK